MSPEELESFLQKGDTVTLLTINPDGTPLPTPLWYVSRGDLIYAGTRRSSQKARNVLGDPRVVAQIEDGLHLHELRAAIINGRAKVVTDAAELAWFKEQMVAKYDDFRPSMTPAAVDQFYAGLLVIKVSPSRILTWDNSKLRTASAG